MFMDINDELKLWQQYAETWLFVMFSHKVASREIYAGFILLPNDTGDWNWSKRPFLSMYLL